MSEEISDRRMGKLMAQSPPVGLSYTRDSIGSSIVTYTWKPILRT